MNNKSHYGMHRLVRDYFKSVYPMQSDSRRVHLFNVSFIENYSEYLIGLMKHVDEAIIDEQFHLETQNLKQFANTVVFTTVDTELDAKSSTALGLLIEENITCAYSVQQRIVKKMLFFYRNVSNFANLCTTRSPKVCARIFWRLFTNLGIPECTSNWPILLNYYVPIFAYDHFIMPSLSWFYDHFCLSALSCVNLEPFWYGETFQNIYEDYVFFNTDERLLYNIVKNRITFCNKFNRYFITFIFITSIFLLYFYLAWRSKKIRTTIVYTAITHAIFCFVSENMLNKFANYALTLSAYYQKQPSRNSSLTSFDESTFNLCKYKDYELQWNSPLLFYFLLVIVLTDAMLPKNKDIMIKDRAFFVYATIALSYCLYKFHPFFSISSWFLLTRILYSVLHHCFVLLFAPIYMISSIQLVLFNLKYFVNIFRNDYVIIFIVSSLFVLFVSSNIYYDIFMQTWFLFQFSSSIKDKYYPADTCC